jgi:hypothetical protein
MIIFDLTCARAHRFEGWFASADDIVRQKDAGLLRCPICDDAAISVVPSAKVRVGRGEPARAPVPAAPATENAEAAQTAGMPREVIDKLREIVRNTENVGRRFPEEARRIHYEETPARAIRGQASKEEADALREEGIEFASLPSFLTHETH